MTGDVAQASRPLMPRTYALLSDGSTVEVRPARLADELPEVAELDLDPVVAAHDGVQAVAARIRVSPVRPRDPFLRRLR